MSRARKTFFESLVDIRDVKIDRSKPVEERMKSYVGRDQESVFIQGRQYNRQSFLRQISGNYQ